MGSTKASSRYVLQQLQCRPHTVCWSQPQPVTLLRGASGKLGLRFKTYPCFQDETATVIVQVKTDCLVDEGVLHVADRIVSVGNVDVTSLDELTVRDVISQSEGSVLQLHVSAPIGTETGTQVKRYLSTNSGTSGSSATGSGDSVERPQVKRLAKSNSEEHSTYLSSASSLDDFLLSGVDMSSSLAPPEAQGRGVGDQSSTSSRPVTMTESNSHHGCAPEASDRCAPEASDRCAPEASDRCAPEASGRCAPEANDRCAPEANYRCAPEASGRCAPEANYRCAPEANYRCAPEANDRCATDGTYRCAPEASDRCAPEASNRCAPDASDADDKLLPVDVTELPGVRRFALEFPQHVVWEAATWKVTLEKGRHPSFGFEYKVKKLKSNCEVFTLVMAVTRGGVADTLLMPGDWILSINSRPIMSENDVASSRIRDLKTLTLVIQRPQGVTDRGKALQQTQSPEPNPPQQPTHPHPDTSPHPSSQHSRHEPAPGCTHKRQQSRHVCPNPSGTYPDTVFAGPASQSSCSAMSVLPWCRVMVCGDDSSCADFVRGLLGHQPSVTVSAEASVQTFRGLAFYFDENLEDCVRITSVPVTDWTQENSSCGTGGSQLQNGNDSRFVNVELYCINDERFVHHCANWLLPTSSVVLLTFLVQDLLYRPELVIGRLAALVQTVRASNDYSQTALCPKVLLYGVMSRSSTSVSVQDIQDVFSKTPLGTRLLGYRALDLAILDQRDSMASARYKLFSMCLSHVQQLSVHKTTVKVCEALSKMERLSFSEQELGYEVQRLADNAAHVMKTVLRDLLITGSVVRCDGHIRRNGRPDQRYLLPVNVCQALSALCHSIHLDISLPSLRRTLYELASSGRASPSELLNLLTSQANPLTPDILEGLGIVFTLRIDYEHQHVMPYFLKDLTVGGPILVDGMDQFVLCFQGFMSWRGYFDMVCRLGTRPMTEVMIQGRSDSTVRYGDHLVHLHRGWGLEFSNVLISVDSDRHMCAESLEEFFSHVIPREVRFTLRPVNSCSDVCSRVQVVSPEPYCQHLQSESWRL